MRIFISYASENNPAAEAIVLSLRSRGHSAFFDDNDLPEGTSYDDRIASAIEKSDLFIFLITPEAVTSGRYTLTELEIARHKWRHPSGFVLPVMLKPTPMKDVPVYLKAVTLVEPHGNTAAEVAIAVERLRGHERALNVAVICAFAGIVAAAIARLMPAIIEKNSFIYLGDGPRSGVALEPGLVFATLFAGIFYKLGASKWWKLAGIAIFVLLAWIACILFISFKSNIFDLKSADISDLAVFISSEEAPEGQLRIKQYKDWVQNQKATIETINISTIFSIKGLVASIIIILGFSIVDRSFRDLYRWVTFSFCGLLTGALGCIIVKYFVENIYVNFVFLEFNDIAFTAMYVPFFAVSSFLLGNWLIRGQLNTFR